MLHQIRPGFSNIYYPRPFFYYPYQPPVIKLPLVINQAEFSLFQYPDYFGFYNQNNKGSQENILVKILINQNIQDKLVPKEVPREVPKLIFTDLNIHSNDYVPGKEWSPSTSTTNSPLSTPRSNGSNTSTPRSNGNNTNSPRSNGSNTNSPRSNGSHGIRKNIIRNNISNITIYKK